MRLIHAALSRSSGPIRFSSSDLGWTSHIAREGEQGVEVDGLSFTDLLERIGPGRTIDILKVDIEGAESNVLGSALSSVATMVVETHDSSGSPTWDPWLDDVASREGMRRVKTPWDSLNWLVRDP